MSQNHLSR